MAREIGTFNFGANFEVLKEGTIDARQLVDDFADLLAFTESNFIPNGFIVAVKGTTTPSERGVYMCIDKDNLDLAASWELVGKSSLEIAANFAAFPESGEEGVIYIANDTDIIYYWKTDQYVALKITPSQIRTTPLTGLTDGEDTPITATDTILSAFGKLKTTISKKLNSALTTGKMLLGVGGVATEIDTDFQYLDNVGNIILTQSYLLANYPSAKLHQIVEGTYQVAQMTLNGWVIAKKNPNQLFTKEVSFADTTFWFPTTKSIDISDYLDYDIIKFNSVVPTIGITEASQAATAVLTLSAASIRFLKNGDVITINSAVDMTEINGSGYIVNNIDYTNNTFELHDETDTPINTSGAAAYGGLGVITIDSGLFEPNIEKIVGLPDGVGMIFESSTSENPTYINTPLNSITTDQLVTETNLNEKLIGRDLGSDRFIFIREGIINKMINASSYEG